LKCDRPMRCPPRKGALPITRLGATETWAVGLRDLDNTLSLALSLNSSHTHTVGARIIPGPIAALNQKGKSNGGAYPWE